MWLCTLRFTWEFLVWRQGRRPERWATVVRSLDRKSSFHLIRGSEQLPQLQWSTFVYFLQPGLSQPCYRISTFRSSQTRGRRGRLCPCGSRRSSQQAFLEHRAATFLWSIQCIYDHEKCAQSQRGDARPPHASVQTTTVLGNASSAWNIIYMPESIQPSYIVITSGKLSLQSAKSQCIFSPNPISWSRWFLSILRKSTYFFPFSMHLVSTNVWRKVFTFMITILGPRSSWFVQ